MVYHPIIEKELLSCKPWMFCKGSVVIGALLYKLIR